MAFFTKEEWSNFEKHDGLNLILKWCVIPEKIIFSLTSIQIMENSKYNTYLLNFLDDQGNIYQAYSPAHFVKQIRRNRKSFQRPYFLSHGLIQRGDSKIAHFEIFYKEENKSFAIFE